jgi:hypothetical protein
MLYDHLDEYDLIEDENFIEEARKKAPSCCQGCSDLTYFVIDETEAFDCGVLKGHIEKSVEPWCNYLLNDCDPTKCFRRKKEIEDIINE